MRLLVTGGAGYIGSICSAVALAAGHRVAIFDNLGHGHKAAVPAGAELVEGDLLDEGSLRDAVGAGFDAVLHFAALIVVPESVARPERYYRNNVGGALHGLGEDHRPETHLIPNVLAVAAGRAEAVELFGTDYDTPDGTCVRDYVHIEDLAAAHFLALEALEAGRHDVYNLGSG